ncbi:MAG: hypothetical protein AB7S68_38310, partial [Polyangiaceae bacterium]
GTGGTTGGTGGTTGGTGGTTGGTGGTTGGTGGTTGGTGGTTGGTGGTTGGTGGTTGGTGGTTGGTGGTTGGTGGTTGGTGGTTGGTGGTTGGTGGTGGMSPTCTPITLSNLTAYSGSLVAGDVDPELGTAETDFFRIEFYDPTAGTADLGAAPEDNYRTCERCVRVFEDTTNRIQYYQMSGSMNLTAVNYYGATGVVSGTTGSISNVTLTEVTLDGSYNSTPVPGGKCVTIQSANWAYDCNNGGSSFGSPSQTACDNCTTDAWNGCCISEYNDCASDQGCIDFEACYQNCTDQSCVTACENANQTGSDLYYTLLICTIGGNDGATGFPGACGDVCQ